MASVPSGTFVVNDFTGGFTDDYINAPSNQGEIVDNFLIRENRSIQTRSGSHVLDPTDAPIIPAGNQRIGNLINYDKNRELFYQSASNIYYRNPTTYSTLQGPTGNALFPQSGVSDHVVFSEWKQQVFLTSDSFERPKKIYMDNNGDYQLRTAGLPELANDPTIVAGAVGASSYLYEFHYHYTYLVDQQEFQDFGPTITVQLENCDDPGTNANAISNIPVLANGADENWDTTNVKIYIYRTVDGKTVGYKIGEIANGVTVFSDTFADANIQENLPLYREGGVLNNDAPPLAKFVHIIDSFSYYAHLKEGTEILKSDILQSAPNDPDSVPAANRITVDDEIKGFLSIQSIPMAFCRKHIYRIEGKYDELGRGGPSAIRIDDTAGCVSHRSIVQAKEFVFWAGNDKFYASDGYKVIPISDHFNERYKAMIDGAVDLENIVGSYDETNERIYWSIQSDDGSSDSDACWILDLRWGLSKASSFTSISGGDSFQPSAITFFNDELVRADPRGYVLVHSEIDTNDPKIDTNLSPDLWGIQPIVWTYRSFATNFGTDALRKWVTRLYLTAINKTNVTIALKAINDDGKLERIFTPIRYRRNFVWGDPEFSWGDTDFVWSSAGMIQESRRFPRKGLRCSYLQMEYTNALGVITSSTNLGAATVTGATATLDVAASDWPIYSVDYYIAFESDGYVQEYLITQRTDDTLTFADLGGSAPIGSQQWVIRGIRKSEVLNLLSYTLLYAPISQSSSMFEAGQSGEIST
jgi:hypothetical protein